MYKRKTKFLIICLLIALFVITSSAFWLLSDKKSANALVEAQTENFTFTLITNEEGENYYKVALKPSLRNTVNLVIIPEKYNNIPVTEIADNGFMSCTKLLRVVLPSSVKKIGNNAFVNCTNLKLVGLSSVEIIGSNAFGMCRNLERLFFPQTVKIVGANILRSNPNNIYLQSTLSEVGDGWDATWNNYFTGDIIEDSIIEDTLFYREIKDESNTKTIGYELTENNIIADDTADIVIYNSFRPNENVDYLPVLNICSEAFIFASANSITIKDRCLDDPTAPKFNHKINIRSNAFSYSQVSNINIEASVTTYHPENLQVGIDTGILGDIIAGDNNGYSTNLFYYSEVKTVTLPEDLEVITDGMFLNCANLEEIKIFGLLYDSKNILPNVKKIGAEAFSSCACIENIYIPSTVETVGEAVFLNWGDLKEQSIYIDIYEDEIPAGWTNDWSVGIADNVEIIYKVLINITIDLDCDGETIIIAVKPGYLMPDIEMPERNGYTFLGVYENKGGRGFQYYTDSMQSAREWNLGDNLILYANWRVKDYNIKYYIDSIILDGYQPDKYTVEDEIIFDKDIAEEYKKPGYTFAWSPAKLTIGTTGDQIITGIYTPIEYSLIYVNYYSVNHNPKHFTVENEFDLIPADKPGYNCSLSPSRIEKGTVLPDGVMTLTVTATYSEKSLGECGTKNYYYIYTVSQLKELATYGTNNKSTFELMNDLTVSNWISIDEFNGWFELNGHTIKYSQTLSPGQDGGFIINNNGIIVNGTFIPSITVIESSEIVSAFIGGICAYNKNGVRDCIVKSNIGSGNEIFNTNTKYVDIYSPNSFTRIGGIVGRNLAAIKNCTNYASIGGELGNCGGISGLNLNATISNCTNYGNLYIERKTKDRGYYGGVTGVATGQNMLIEKCSNWGTIAYTVQTCPSPAILSIGQIAGMVHTVVTIKDCQCHGRFYSQGVYINNNFSNLISQGEVGEYVNYDYNSGSGDDGECIAEGSLITLADGSQKAVEQLTGEEMLLVWNLYTGTFDVAPILFIDSDPARTYEVINLYFSDGTAVKIISEHAFWDFDLNEYVFLRKDAAKYIGHWFNKQITGDLGELSWAKVQLLDVVVNEEYTTSWSPITYGHLCYYVNGMLSMPGATEGLINIFEVDSETLKINEYLMQNDIETYGLFTYEEFAEIYPVTEEVFNAFSGQFLKISIGKGLISLEQIGELINRYAEFLN